MAVVRLSGMVSGIKGKLGGSVFQGGIGGTILRQNRNFNKPMSPNWAHSKNTLSNLAQIWRTISPSQQLAWASAAVDYPAIDKYGNPYTPSGFQLFLTLNGPLRHLNLSYLSDPPSPAIIANIVNFSLSGVTPVSITGVWDAPFSGDELIEIYATVSRSTGRNTVTGGYTLLQTSIDTFTHSVDFSTNYINRFGNLIEGSKVFAYAQIINIVTGQKGQIYRTSAIVS